MSEIYSIATRPDGRHHIRWPDGVEALVTGAWTDAALIAQARAATTRLRDVADTLHVLTLDLESSAAMVRNVAGEAARTVASLLPRAATMTTGSNT